MIYITGDTHGDFYDIEEFCEYWETTTDDVIIILGDAGINFHGYPDDYTKKMNLSRLPITLFCIHGNHEIRPWNISTYEETEAFGATAYVEEEFPNLIFAKDGEIYEFGGRKCIAIGGANSVDKHLRVRGVSWWEDEQPDDIIKRYVESQLDSVDWEIDTVFSHTCPFRYMPHEAFLTISGEQADRSGRFDDYCASNSSIDNSTEKWLDEIEQKLDYVEWYCGHFHTEKYIDKMRFMFHSIDEFEEYEADYD